METEHKYFTKSQMQIIDDVRRRHKHLSIRKQAEILSQNKVFAGLTADAIRMRLMRMIKSNHWNSQNDDLDIDLLNTIDEIPEGFDDDPIIHELDGDVGILCDIHAPYHSKLALLTAINELQDVNPKYLLLNGDFLDFKSLGRFGKKASEWDINEELKVGNQILDYLGRRFSNIIYRIGNHEVWLEKYINKEAPAIANLDAVSIQSLLHLNERGIKTVGFKDTIKLGDLNIIHGHEIPAGGSINVARNKLINSFTNVLFGHHHFKDERIERSLSGQPIGAWGVGCLCGLKPEYRRINNWVHGFATVEVFNDGSFEVENKKLINYKVK